eukprot:INCI4596.1.p1 GENE.INCI4596.1~~INCI4596.1.p1  ORF type:complete len:444 (-),score=61.43 INCI4596.1:295-1626(-)
MVSGAAANDAPQCTSHKSLETVIAPPAGNSGCQLNVSSKRFQYFGQAMLAFESIEISTADLEQFFEENFKWKCSEPGKPPPKATGVILSVREDGSRRVLEAAFDESHSLSAKYSAVARHRYRLSTSDTRTVRIVECPLASKRAVQIVVGFHWFGTPVELEVNSSKAFNWLRLGASLSWAYQMSDSLVRDLRLALTNDNESDNIVKKMINSSSDWQPPTTATMVAPAVARLESSGCKSSVRFLDVGAGSGFVSVLVAVALNASFPDAPLCFHVVSTDVMEDATQLQESNVRRNHLQDVITVVLGDMFEPVVEAGFASAFDAVFFYPPQVRRKPIDMCETCGPNASLYVNGAGSGAKGGNAANSLNAESYFFERFAAGVHDVLRPLKTSSRRVWLGTDPDNMIHASHIERCIPHGCFTFIDHPSELIEHLCLTGEEHLWNEADWC